MLVLTRKSNQSIMIGDDIEVSVLAIMGEKVRIGIQAPRDVPVFRKEVYLEIQQERGESGKDVRTMNPSQGPVRCLAFSPDGKELASGGADRHLYVYTVADGKVKFKEQAQVLVNETQPVVTGVSYVCDVEGLAVQLTPDNRASGAEIAAAEAFRERARGGAVGQREETMAEIEHHQRVVVGLGGIQPSPELPLAQPHARHGRYAPGRAQDAGQRVQRVHRHVV